MKKEGIGFTQAPKNAKELIEKGRMLRKKPEHNL